MGLPVHAGTSSVPLSSPSRAQLHPHSNHGLGGFCLLIFIPKKILSGGHGTYCAWVVVRPCVCARACVGVIRRRKAYVHVHASMCVLSSARQWHVLPPGSHCPATSDEARSHCLSSSLTGPQLPRKLPDVPPGHPVCGCRPPGDECGMRCRWLRNGDLGACYMLQVLQPLRSATPPAAHWFHL